MTQLTDDEVAFVRRMYRIRKWMMAGFWTAIGGAIATAVLAAIFG